MLSQFAELLDSLDKASAGKESRAQIVWPNDLLLILKTAQLTPIPQHALWIVTDGPFKKKEASRPHYMYN